LSLGEHKALARVEASIDSMHVAVLGCDIQDTRKTIKIQSCATGFEDEFMG
jgi:hypothetical protein